jgi:hypothetical protein
VLKNFPSEQDVRSVLADGGTNITFTTWPRYWALDHNVAARLTPA